MTSWWALRYMDGRVITEGEVDWSNAPLRGRQAVRLYCPNGQVAELGNDAGADGRLFQFKIAALVGGDRERIAQVVGLVENVDGTCRYAAWDGERLVTGQDNVYAMKYQQVGLLAFEPLGLRL